MSSSKLLHISFKLNTHVDQACVALIALFVLIFLIINDLNDNNLMPYRAAARALTNHKMLKSFEPLHNYEILPFSYAQLSFSQYLSDCISSNAFQLSNAPSH